MDAKNLLKDFLNAWSAKKDLLLNLICFAMQTIVEDLLKKQEIVKLVQHILE